MVAEREMGRGIAKRRAQRHAFTIQRIMHRADTGLRAFIMDVPFVEMRNRAGIHDDQGRMDNRSGIHQCRRKRVFNRFDGPGKGRADDSQRPIGMAGRVDPGRQARCACCDGDSLQPVLVRTPPCQPGKRAGLGKRHIRPATMLPAEIGHDIAAKTAGRQENNLTVLEMRGQLFCHIRLRKGGGGKQDQISAADRITDIGNHSGKLQVVPAIMVQKAQWRFFGKAAETGKIAPPETDLMPGKGKIGGRRIGPVAPAENCNIHVPCPL